MIHSPPLSMNRVSPKQLIFARIAAQEADAVNPTPVTMPALATATASGEIWRGGLPIIAAVVGGG
jgi:hypothetical protein